MLGYMTYLCRYYFSSMGTPHRQIFHCSQSTFLLELLAAGAKRGPAGLAERQVMHSKKERMNGRPIGH